MNKVLSISAACLLAISATPLYAATYGVSGFFAGGTGAQWSIGGENLAQNIGGLTIAGSITTDSSGAGYNVTGGTITMNGSITLNPNGTPVLIDVNLTGQASNDGVLFTSGTICTTVVTQCDYGLMDASYSSVSFESGDPWYFFDIGGIQLIGGAGGGSFSVAQLGGISPENLVSGAAGSFDPILGQPNGIFLDGDLTFSEVPLPGAVWLFGTGLVGLAGLKRRA